MFSSAPGYFSRVNRAHVFTIESISNVVTNVNSATDTADIKVKASIRRTTDTAFGNHLSPLLVDVTNSDGTDYAETTPNNIKYYDYDFTLKKRGSLIAEKDKATAKYLEMEFTVQKVPVGLHDLEYKVSRVANPPPEQQFKVFANLTPSTNPNADLRLQTGILVNQIPKLVLSPSIDITENVKFKVLGEGGKLDIKDLATDDDESDLEFTFASADETKLRKNSDGSFTYVEDISSLAMATINYTVTDGHISAPLNGEIKLTVSPYTPATFFYVDDVPPIVSSPGMDTPLTGDFVTNDRMLEFKGMGVPEADVTVTFNSPTGIKPLPGEVKSDKTWNVPVTTELTDGTYNVTIKVDAEGTVEQTTFNFTVDTVAPSKPGLPDDIAPQITNAIDRFSFKPATDSRTDIRGYRVGINNDRFVFVGNKDITASNGEISFDLTKFIAADEVNQTFFIRIRAEDSAGNVGAPNFYWVEYDKPKEINPGDPEDLNKLRLLTSTKRSHAGGELMNIQLVEHQVAEQDKSSLLPVPVVTTRKPLVQVHVADQQFIARVNSVKAYLQIDGASVSAINHLGVADQVQISVGTDSGLSTNQIFDVVRNGSVIGQIRLTQIDASNSVAKIVNVVAGERISAGDIVTSFTTARNWAPLGGKFGAHQPVVDKDPNVVEPTDPKSITMFPKWRLPVGNHSFKVILKDRAGNEIESETLTVYVKDKNAQTSAPSLYAPGTPTYTSRYFFGAEIVRRISDTEIEVDQPIAKGLAIFVDGAGGNIGNLVTASSPIPDPIKPDTTNYRLTLTEELPDTAEKGSRLAWLRPWQMSFDKSTQTIWFTNEDGNGLGQFDPATGRTRIYDVAMRIGDDAQATDPHGAFFDFNSHLTPRVWFVYRNNSITDKPARVSYFDITEKQLYTYGLSEGTGNVSDQLFEPSEALKESHAIFVDDTGDVWLTAEEGGETEGALVHLDFDNGSLGSNSGQAIVHQIPKTLNPETDPEKPFLVHGVQAVVDENTGQQFVYFLDGNQRGGSTNTIVGMLAPGIPATTTDSGTPDRWYSWNVPTLGDGIPHLLFTAIDDNETPGLPNDDSLVFTDPGFVFTGTGKGIFARVGVHNVVDAIQNPAKYPVFPTESDVQFTIVNNIPGTTTAESGPNQSFVDRAGTIFAVDPQGSAIRFNFDDLELASAAIMDVAQITRLEDRKAPLSASITMTQVTTFSSIPIVDTVINQSPQLMDVFFEDAATNDFVDQYELAAIPERRTNGFGAFRGALNATNVLYGSMSQADQISTTIFAETARKSMAVVQSPVRKPGILEGRMAFQVTNDGSLVMTGRADGQVFDEELDITAELVKRGFNIDNLRIAGDVTAETDSNNKVHVIGKQRMPSGGTQLIAFTYHGSWDDAPAITRGANWTVQTMQFTNATNPDLLIGDPTAYVDEATGKVKVAVTTNQGRLMLFELGKPTGTMMAPGFNHPDLRMYASPGVVQRGPWTFIYGTNQKGDLIEFGYRDSNPATAYAKKVVIDNIHAGQTARDVKVFQDVEAVLIGNKRHVYATDAHSRMVHISIDKGGNDVTYAQNVTQSVADTMDDNELGFRTLTDANGNVVRDSNGDPIQVRVSVDTLRDDMAEGYFPFQEEFAGRLYSGLEVLVNDKGEQFVYGTNGGELILLYQQKDQNGNDKPWRAANLTNDIYSSSGNIEDRTGPAANRIAGNNVFGSSGGYIDLETGDRHLFQINGQGEVIEYYIQFIPGEQPRFHTQNISLLIDARNGSNGTT